MDEILEVALSDPVNSVSVLLTLAAILLAYIFYRRSQRNKTPIWAIRTASLIEGYGSHLEDLQVLYKDEKIENLAVSRVLLWNAGRETIDGPDITEANPLRLESADQVTILDARVVASNNPSSQFNVEKLADRQAHILFDYLDRNDGGVVQVVHTGTSSKDLKVVGDLKGAEPLQRKRIRVYSTLPLPAPASINQRFKPSTRRRARAIVLLVLSVFSLVVVIQSLSAFARADSPGDPASLFLAVLYLIILFPTAGVGFYIWRMQPPSGLEAYEHDFLGGD